MFHLCPGCGVETVGAKFCVDCDTEHRTTAHHLQAVPPARDLTPASSHSRHHLHDDGHAA